ncbi:MAG: glycosyltransferase family 2 protein [Rhodobacteraceae bacterium]|nr:MAG: glycosyltransferase family 2 protein [Paracoccaceae bacterium]
MTKLVILTVRNEAAFLLEWLAHHLASGFDHVLAFSNDCQDGTDAMLDRLAQLGHVTHVRNDGPHDRRGIQFTALNRAQDLQVVRGAEWLLPIDIDEFVNIHVGDRTVSALLAALPEATAITLTWRLFGNAGQVRYTDRPVTEVFTRAAPVDMPWPWRAAMFKTLYRNDGTYRKLGVHRPRNPDPARLAAARWFDGEGRALDDQFKTRRIFSSYGRSNVRLVQLNHYALGAMESYVLKADRGRAVHSDHLLGLDYWVERNFNTEADTSIGLMAPRRDAILDALRGDAVLGPLHEAAVAWRRARFDALMLQEPYRALFARLLMTPPSQPLGQPTARVLMHYANLGRMAGNKDAH